MQVGESSLIDHLEGVGGGRTKHISGPWLREEGHPKDRQTHVRQTDKTKGRERGVDREREEEQTDAWGETQARIWAWNHSEFSGKTALVSNSPFAQKPAALATLVTHSQQERNSSAPQTLASGVHVFSPRAVCAAHLP